MKRLSIILLLIPFAFMAFIKSEEKPQENTCLDCHADLLKNKVVHEAAPDGCEFCHTANGKEHPGDEPGFTFESAVPEMCYMCHEEKTNKSNVHTALADGDCSICHSPHSSPNKALIAEGYSENMCLDCHYFETEGARSLHGPFMDGDCLDCHDAHQSDFLYSMKMETNKLCLSCHDKAIQTNKESIHSIASDLADGNDIHEAVSDGDCSTCHAGHSAVNHFLLLGKYPNSQYTKVSEESFELCFMCHDYQMLTMPETDYATNFRNGKRNLHQLHIRDSRGRNCDLCHNVHGAPNEHLIENSVMYGSWEMPLNFEATENGGSCATGCHKRLEYSRIINDK